MDHQRFIDWSFGHYLRIAPPGFALEGELPPVDAEPVRRGGVGSPQSSPRRCRTGVAGDSAAGTFALEHALYRSLRGGRCGLCPGDVRAGQTRPERP